MKKRRALILCCACIIILLWCACALWYASYHTKINQEQLACMDEIDEWLYSLLETDFIPHSTIIENSIKENWKNGYQGSVIYKNGNWINTKLHVSCFVGNDTISLERGDIEENVERLQDEINKNLESTSDSETDRITACEERVGFLLNYNTWSFTRENEIEDWTYYIRNWHVSYVKRWEKAEDNVKCIINKANDSIDVEFSDHQYNWPAEEE